MQGAARRSLLDPPGGVLLWIIVALELLAFGVLFVMVGWLRLSDPAAFASGQAALDPLVGLGLTFTLVTSGWLLAEGVSAYRGKRLELCRRYYLGAIVVGLAFVLLKVHDYATKIGAGHTLGVSDFWDAYLLGTGFHFAHVLVGLGLLMFVGRKIGRAPFDDDETAIAGLALFWHMCDVAWFFLFPLFFVRA